MLFAREQHRETPAKVASTKAAWWWFMVLPCLFLAVYAVFVVARGPFYLGFNFDPDYPYLCNSLNLATGRSPQHTDHPGTSLQALGAAVITVMHPFAGKAEKADNVLRAPERYLQAINLALVAIYTACLALVGITVWRRTGEWHLGLLFQAAPFLLGSQFLVVTRVSAEPLLLIIGLLLAALLFLDARLDQPHRYATGLLAFLAVTGTITKISFLPLALVPLGSMRNWKQRATFLLFAGAFAFMWLFPLGRHKSRFFGWIQGLILRQGRYGYGEAGILPPEYFSNLLRLVTENPWLCFSVALSWTTVLYGCLGWKRQTPQQRRGLLLLGCLALGQTLQILMVAKYGEWRYLLPALMFCPLNLLLLIEFWGSRWPGLRRGMTAVTVLAVVLSANSLPPLHSQLSKSKEASMEIVRALDNDFKQEPKVFYYGASSRYHALWFGNYWAGGHYTKRLRKIFESYAPAYLVEEGTGELRFAADQPKLLRELGGQHPSFLLVGSKGLATRVRGFLPPNVETEILLQTSYGIITKVTVPSSPE